MNTVKYIREQRGLKAVYVSEKTGISQKMLSAIECGRAKLTLDNAIALANFYNVSLDCLVGRDFDNRKSA